MGSWTVRPLHVGTLHRKRCEFLWRNRDVAPFDAAVIMYVLESDGVRVLVDTGCSDPEHAQPSHHPFDRTPEQHPIAALAKHGIESASIAMVINTHLHWDHSSGNAHFPAARILVQREELRWAAAPLPWARRSYMPAKNETLPPWASSAFEPLDGDVTPYQGLHILATPGHTPGSQSVLVEAKTQRYLLAGDNVPLYDNWEGHGAAWPFIPNENHYDLSSYARTMDRCKALGATVIPSHDFRALDTALYE